VAETACVHVIDDDAAVRDSLAMLLESAGLAVRTYESAVAFLATGAISGLGCVLTDVRMPDIDGLALQRKLAESGKHLPVIVMTGHGDVPIAVAALKTGATDFLQKPFDDEHLLGVLREALAASARSREQEQATTSIVARLASLTPREREVLERLVVGEQNKVIAHELGSSPRTVEVHRSRVMEKMHARSVADLVRSIALERDGEHRRRD